MCHQKKQHVYVLLSLIDDDRDREYLQELSNSNKFPFTYKGLVDTEPNPGHGVDNFIPSQTIAMQFQIYLLSFRSKQKPNDRFTYALRLISLYLIRPAEEPQYSTPSRKKHGPNK